MKKVLLSNFNFYGIIKLYRVQVRFKFTYALKNVHGGAK